MKKIRLKIILPLILLLSTIPTIRASQEYTTSDSIGLIVLSERYGDNDFVYLYNADGSLWHKFTFYYEARGEQLVSNEQFQPFAFHIDYFLLALKCVRKESGRYEVIVNEDTGLKKYVKANDPSLRFETWAEHLQNVFSVTFDQKVNPILEAPQGRVKKVASADEFFHPVAVRGEWLKIKWEVATGGSPKEPKYDSGWIRWRRGNRLLVELFYFA